MNDIYTLDLTRLLPDSLKTDPKMQALARMIADELTGTGKQIHKNIIYARLEEQPEEVLDVLAYDLHVDWYDYEYPVAAKRAIIRDSVRVHKRLGTKFAVELAVGAVYPESVVEEWFEYEGQPYTFRVVLDVTEPRVPIDLDKLIREILFYKSLRSHLDAITFQSRVNIAVEISAEAIIFETGTTGGYLTGTKPRRNTFGRTIETVTGISEDGNAFFPKVDLTGTKPFRSMIGSIKDDTICVIEVPEGFAMETGLTGEYLTGTEPREKYTRTIVKHVYRGLRWR